MNQAQNYFKSLRKQAGYFYFYNCLVEAEELFKNGNYFESIVATLNYLNYSPFVHQGIFPHDLNQAFPYQNVPKQFTLSHSSAGLEFDLNGKFSINCNFIELPESKRVPLLRALVSLNQSDMIIPEITIEGNNVLVTHESPLDLTHPDKVCNVIQAICYSVDHHDDLFVDKFGAKLMHTPKAIQLEGSELDEVFRVYQEIAKDALSRAESSIMKNQHAAAYYALFLAMYQQNYVFDAQGALSSKLGEVYGKAMDTDWQSSIPYMRKWLEQFADMPKEKFAESAYHAQYISSPRRPMDSMSIAQYIEPFQDRVQAMLRNQDYDMASLTQAWVFYKLFFHFELPAEETAAIEGALQAAQSKPWKESADILNVVFNQLIQRQHQTQQAA